MWPLVGGLSVEKPLPDLPEKARKSSTSFAFDSNHFFLFFFFNQNSADWIADQDNGILNFLKEMLPMPLCKDQIV